jgi:Cupredoxin-like domain
MHVEVPDKETEVHDQAEFDDTVEKTGKTVIEVLAGVGIFAALLMSIIALNQSSEHNTVTVTSGTALATTGVATGGAQAAAIPAKLISLKIIPEGKLGPDGKKHDAYTETEFAVKAGQTLKLTIDNTDEGEHSITSPEIGVNIVVKPGIHTYQMTVKEKGRFSWFCVIPCDSNANGWAMQHAGYMSGYITVT